MNRFFKLIASPYALLLSLLVVLPMLMILTKAIFVDGQFSISTITYLFENEVLRDSLMYSMVLALKVTLVTLLLALPICLTIWKINSKMKAFVILMISMPMWINMVARTRAMELLFEDFSWLQPSDQVVIALAMVYLPFMVMSINNQLNKVSFTYVEAARDLGSNDAKVFSKVLFPLITPGILAGINLVLLPSATSIIIPQILDPNGDKTLGQRIEDFGGLDLQKYAAGMSIVIIVIMIITIIAIEHFSKKVQHD